MSRQNIGEALAARLYTAEAAIDRAMAETAALAAALPGARAEAYLSAVTGQRAFRGAAATISALAEASDSRRWPSGRSTSRAIRRRLAAGCVRKATQPTAWSTNPYRILQSRVKTSFTVSVWRLPWIRLKSSPAWPAMT